MINCNWLWPKIEETGSKHEYIISGRTKETPTKFHRLRLERWNDWSRDDYLHCIDVDAFHKAANALLAGDRRYISSARIRRFKLAFERVFPLYSLTENISAHHIWERLTHLISIEVFDAFTCANGYTLFAIGCNFQLGGMVPGDISNRVLNSLVDEIENGPPFRAIKNFNLTGKPIVEKGNNYPLSEDWINLEPAELKSRVYQTWLMAITFCYLGIAEAHNIDLSPDANWGLR